MYRQTGRTTRMLERAREEIRRGKEVVIIAGNEAQRRYYKSMAEVGRVITIDDADRLKGLRPIIFVDHWAIEIMCELGLRKYSDMMRMIGEYGRNIEGKYKITITGQIEVSNDHD